MRSFFVFLSITLVFDQTLADLTETDFLNRLFVSCEKPTLDVAQTKSLLEDLLEFYKRDPKKFISMQGVAEYLDMAELAGRAECHSEKIYSKIEYLINLAKDHCNMVQFLQHYKQLYTDRCNEVLLKHYSPILNKLPRGSLLELTKLTRSVEAANYGKLNPTRPFYSDAALIEGIYNYLVKLTTGTKLSNKQMRGKLGGIKTKKFFEFYESKIEVICDQAGDGFKIASKELLDSFEASPRAFNSLDESIKLGLYGGSICIDVADKKKNVGTSVYDTFINRVYNTFINYKHDHNKLETVMQYLVHCCQSNKI